MQGDFEYRKICCAVDFSGPSRHALKAAADLARRFGAELTLLHVEQPGDHWSDADMAEFKKEAETQGAPKVTVAREEGRPHTFIAEWTRTHGYDLIVLGTHGRKGRAASLVGSVAESVVRHAYCPVITLHEGWPKR